MEIHTLASLAARFGLEAAGDAATVITGVCALDAGGAGQLAYLANPKHATALASTQAAAVVVHPRQAAELRTPGLIAKDPMLAFARIAQLFDPSRQVSPGVSPAAHIDSSARIGPGCRIEAFAVIEADAQIGAGSQIGAGTVVGRGAQLGEGARVGARVVIHDGVCIGARVNILPGAVIGSRGFGNARGADGRWEELPQFGSVRIGDDVEIGANTTVDRGAFGDTVLEDGVKLDNQIQIAHNCVIGAHTAIAGSAGVAGSTTIGQRCMIGGAVNIGGHLSVCADVVILGRAMVTGHITEPGVYGSGLPFAPAQEWRKTVARVRRLDKLEDRIKRLERAARQSPADTISDDREGDA